MSIKKRVITAVIIIVIGVISFFGLGSWAENPETYSGTTAKLEEFQDNALVLSATATASATAAAAIPGDATTPVANKLADIAGYVVIIYAALTIEKYMMILAGSLLFKIIIPLAALFFLILLLAKRVDTKWTYVILRVLSVFIVLWALVPVSMYVSTKVQDIHQTTAEAKLEQVQKENKHLDKEAAEEKEKNNSQGDSFVSRFFDGVKDTAIDAKASATKIAKTYEARLDNLIECVAVMIVTACIIPFIVMAIMLWATRLILMPGASFRIPRLPRASAYIKNNKKKNMLDENA